MQVKIKGSRIQLLRSHYVKEKKRTTQKMVAGFSKDYNFLPDDVREKLSDEEAAQVDAWLADRKEQEEACNRSWAVDHAQYRLDGISEALEAGQAISAEQIEKVRASIKTLQGSLRKAVKRNKKAAEEAAKTEAETDS